MKLYSLPSAKGKKKTDSWCVTEQQHLESEILLPHTHPQQSFSYPEFLKELCNFQQVPSERKKCISKFEILLSLINARINWQETRKLKAGVYSCIQIQTRVQNKFI